MSNTYYTLTEENTLEILFSGNYLIVNRNLLKKLGPNKAVLLSNLINTYRHLKSIRQIRGSWFFLTYAMQESQTGLSVTILRSCKMELIKLGLIQTCRKGNPAKEWYKINLDQCLGFLTTRDEETSSQEINRPNHSINYVNIKIKENINNCPDLRSGTDKDRKRPIKDQKNKKYLPIARHLSKTICLEKNMKHTPGQLKKWSNEIRILSESNKIESFRIKKALRWYRLHIGGQFVPVIASGYSLRHKFTNLEAAMSREGTSYKKPTPVGSRKFRTSIKTTNYDQKTIQYAND